VIIGSEICTHRPSFSFVVNELSRNKVVVLEGAAEFSVNQIISISWVSFMLNYYAVQFGMVWFC